MCLTGVSTGGRPSTSTRARSTATLVLENNVVFGSVNANRRHWRPAAEALARPTPPGSSELITRRVPVERWHEAYQPTQDDVKTVLQFAPV